MSRRVITSENTPSVFDQYAEIKPQFDAIKKKETELKDLVKQKFLADGLGEYESDKYKLTLTKTENTSLDMDKLIVLLINEYGEQKLLSNGVLEEKLFVNEERLQELIYEKEIDGSLFTNCLVHKAPTYTLRYKEIK